MWIKAVKWLLLVASAAGMVYFVYNLGYGHGIQTGTANLETYKRQVLEQQFEVWSKYQQSSREIEADYIDRLEQQRTEADRIIADYRRGALRLRRQANSSKLPASDSTSGDNAGAAGYIQGRDVERLIRIADRADQTAEQLKACQAILREVSADGT